MIKNIFSDKNFDLLLKASSFNAVAKIVGITFGFLASLLIARTYGSDLVGKVAAITSVFTILSLFALLGNQTLIVKVLPQYIERYNYSIAKRVYLRVVVITSGLTLGMISLWISLEITTRFTLLKNLEEYTFLVAFLIAASTFQRLNTKALRGLGDYKIYSYFEILPAIFLALTAILAIVFNYPEHQFQYLYFSPLLLMSILSFYFVNRVFTLKSLKTEPRIIDDAIIPTKTSLITTSIPMFGVTISTTVISHFDILMLNYYYPPDIVGVYSVYAKITAVTAFATHSINSMFAPTVSRLFSSNKRSELRNFAKKTTLLSFSISLLLTFLLLLTHKPILGFYGAEFTLELSTLYVLLLSSLVSSFCGSVGLYLNMTGQQTPFFRIMLFAALINIALNVLLIPLLGSLGAAWATLASVLTWNLLATRRILKEFKYTLVWSGGFYA